MSVFASLRRARALLGGLLLLAAACSNPAVPNPSPTPQPQPLPGPKPVAAVAVSPAALTLEVNASQQLTVTLRAADSTLLADRDVQWSSDDATKVAVDANGRVTAVAAGSAKITAWSEGKTGTMQVTVPVQQPVAVAHVVLSPGNANLEPGQSVGTTLRVYDAQGQILTGRAVTYTSSNETVATVDAMGRIRAQQGGTAWITAEVEGKTARVHVEVPMWLEYRVNTINGPAFTYTVTRRMYDGKDAEVRVTLLAGILRRSTTSTAYELHLTLQQQTEGYYIVDRIITDRGTVEWSWTPGLKLVSTTTPGQEIFVGVTNTTLKAFQLPIEGEVKADLTFQKF